MGKASKWFRGLFGLKKSSSNDTDYVKKRRWSFVKSYKEKEQEQQQQQEPRHHFQNHRQVNDTPKPVVSDPYPLKNDTEKHAVAVVSTAVGNREEWAALKIQSAFRGCLARKALRALKGLVKIQALVRGHIERKRTAEWLHRMQIMMQAQARAIIGRSELAKPINNPFAHHTGPSTPEKVEHVIRSRSRKYEQSSLLRRNSTRLNGRSQSDEKFAGYLRSYSAATNAMTPTTTNCDDKSYRNVEINAVLHGKPNRRSLLFHHQYCPVEEHEARSLSGPPRPDCCDDDEDEATSFCTAENDSPIFHSASSLRGARTRSPFAPSTNDGSASFLSGLSDGPGYMGCTESSRARARARVRSASAPKHRPKYERSSSAKTRYSLVNGDPAPPRLVNAKAYPGSGRLDKLGMPIAYRY